MYIDSKYRLTLICPYDSPFMERGFDNDRGLPDPTGQSDEVFLTVIQEIERRVIDLRDSLK